jgi:phage baseplate assembly protein W
MRESIKAIRYPLSVDTGLGRLAQESNYAEHVEQLMRQVLFTNPGERVNRPDFGCGIRRMVFAPNSETSASLAQITVVQALETWLGDLISVDRVEIKSIDEVLEIKIIYFIKAQQQRRYLNLEVTL